MKGLRSNRWQRELLKMMMIKGDEREEEENREAKIKTLMMRREGE